MMIVPTFPLSYDVILPQTLLPKRPVPSYLKIGDILFYDLKSSAIKIMDERDYYPVSIASGYSNDHCMMYIGNNKFIESCPYYYDQEHHQYYGVVITPYELIFLYATNITFASVTTTQEIRNKAVDWAKNKLGTVYGNQGFYCAELIWHAYHAQNVTLDYTTSINTTIDAQYPRLLRNADQLVFYK
jgi:uncharacterized protein YycO